MTLTHSAPKENGQRFASTARGEPGFSASVSLNSLSQVDGLKSCPAAWGTPMSGGGDVNGDLFASTICYSGIFRPGSYHRSAPRYLGGDSVREAVW